MDEAEIGLENLGSLGKAWEGQRGSGMGGSGMGGSGGPVRLGNERLGVTWRLGETCGLGEGQHWEVSSHLSSRLFFRLPPARFAFPVFVRGVRGVRGVRKSCCE